MRSYILVEPKKKRPTHVVAALHTRTSMQAVFVHREDGDRPSTRMYVGSVIPMHWVGFTMASSVWFSTLVKRN